MNQTKNNYESKLEESVESEQWAIVHVIDNFLGKEFKSGVYKRKDVVWSVHNMSDLLHGKPNVPYMKEITIEKNPYVQKILGIDFAIQGTGLTFDAKGNGSYPGGRCEIELYDLGNGFYKYWGYSQAKYIVCYMRATGKCFVFNRTKLLEIVNCYALPAWFKKAAYWEIINANEPEKPNKRHLLFKPWIMSKLLRLMSNKGNPEALELPTKKYSYRNGVYLPVSA